MRERLAKTQGLELNELSAHSILPSKNQMLTLGIFGSTSPSFVKSQQCAVFNELVRASFRSISLVKPNLEHALQHLFFVENFTEFKS